MLVEHLALMQLQIPHGESRRSLPIQEAMTEIEGAQIHLGSLQELLQDRVHLGVALGGGPELLVEEAEELGGDHRELFGFFGGGGLGCPGTPETQAGGGEDGLEEDLEERVVEHFGDVPEEIVFLDKHEDQFEHP
jgi:hypothetical protein